MIFIETTKTIQSHASFFDEYTNSTFEYLILLRKIFDLFGGAKRDRTADLLHAMQALSQLSYSPTKDNK
nr:hypothetical protein BAR15_10104 [Bartonella sp. AR 15-3]